jgi:predicted TIM-barrel fold metal-dependent hydrolase
MIIDIHTHIFPKPMRESRDMFFPGEAAFERLYHSTTSKLVGASELIAVMDEEGVDKAVTFGFPWRSMEKNRRHNDYILEAVARFPDRLIGFCCLDPMLPDAAEETQRCLEAGMAGVGELAFYCSAMDGACLDGLAPVMDLCRQFDCPVMIHTNEPVGHSYPGKTDNTLAQIYALIKRYPENRIILAHWGGGIFLYCLLKKEVSQTLAKVWFDTAASPFLYRPEIYRQAMDLAGEDKVLWGTDYPLIRPGRYFNEIRKAGLSDRQQDRVLGNNAAVLLGIHR